MRAKTGTMIQDFTSGNVAKQLIAFSTPLFLSNLLQVVYNMVDMIIVGNAAGQAGLSAISIGGDITNCLTFLAMGFSNAGQVIISQYIGARQYERVGKFIGTMSTFLLAIALVVTVLGLILRNEILVWMNTPADAWNDAMDYSVTCMLGLLFIYGYNTVSAVMRGMGDSHHPFIFISMAALINIALDILFVVYFKLSALGAALATVISQMFSFVCAVVFLVKKRGEFGFQIDKKSFIADKNMLADLIKLGVPMAIKQSSIQFSKLFVNSWINSYGITVSAVAGIGNKLNSISNLISNSVNTAGSSMVGQNIGARKYKRVPMIMITAFIITFSISLVLSAAMFVFPEQIFMLFTDDMSIMGVAMQFVPVSYLIFLGSACRSPMNALINGSGNYKVNFAVAMLDGIILRIGLAVFMGIVINMGYTGFWYGDAIAGFTPLAIGIVYYFTGSWKRSKYVEEG